MSQYTQTRDWNDVLDEAEGKFNADRAMARKLAEALRSLLTYIDPESRATGASPIVAARDLLAEYNAAVASPQRDAQ